MTSLCSVQGFEGAMATIMEPVMQTALSKRLAVFVAVLAIGATGCGTAPTGSPLPASPSATGAIAPSGQAAALDWPAPANPMDLAVKAGLNPQPKEFKTNHVHAHLDVFVDGKTVMVPTGIGIKIDDHAVQVDDLPDGTKNYGGIELCNEPCISPLHTHDATGIVHTESATPEPNTLGEFFTEWGVTLDASCVATYCSPSTPIAIYIDGALSTGDPRAIELTDRREIAIVIGTPPAEIPKTADFSNA
jgi:hypothetical protein